LFREWSEADFPKLLSYYLGFGKSYLIPFTPNFGIGEGIVNITPFFKIAGFSLFKLLAKS
jgi:hypothetical protein